MPTSKQKKCANAERNLRGDGAAAAMWLADLQVLRYAKMINGIDSLVVTKLDVFDTQREIRVCVGYKYKALR